jgi:CRP-like cAMP-binding protein
MIFSYKEFSSLTSDQLIGDLYHPFRTETAKAETDLHLGILEKKIFFDFLCEEKTRLKNREISFIHENFFFNPIRKTVFENRYFKELILEEYPRGYEIFRENSPVNEIFITKDGSIELTINKNLLDLHSLTKNLSNVDESLKNFTEKFDDFELGSQPKNYLEKLTKKTKFLIFKFCSKEIMGIEDYFYNVNHSYTATVVSKKAKVYRLNIDKLNVLLNDERKCQNEFKKLAFTRMTLLLERLLNLKNSNLELIDSKYTNSMKREFLLRSCEKNLLSSNHKSVNIKKQKVKKVKERERQSFLLKSGEIIRDMNKGSNSYDMMIKDESQILEKTQKNEKNGKNGKNEILEKFKKINHDQKNIPSPLPLKTDSSKKNITTTNITNINLKTITITKHDKNEKLEKNKNEKIDYLEHKKFIYEDSQIKHLTIEYNKLKEDIKKNKQINHYNYETAVYSEYENLDRSQSQSQSKSNIKSINKSNFISINKSNSSILYKKPTSLSNNSLISQVSSTKDSSCALVNLLPDITANEKRTFEAKSRTTLTNLKEKKFITANEFSKVKKKFLLPMLNKMQDKLQTEKNSKNCKKNKKKVESGVKMLVINTKTDNYDDDCCYSYNKSEESAVRQFNKEIELLETNRQPNSESWMITGS